MYNDLLFDLRYAELKKKHPQIPMYALCGRAADAIEKLQTIISLYKKATGIEIGCDLVPLKEWEKRMKDGVL